MPACQPLRLSPASDAVVTRHRHGRANQKRIRAHGRRVQELGKNSPVPRWGRARAVEVFAADLRSLAAFRVVLAVIVLADLASRVTNLSAHYTDAGVLPRGVLLQQLNAWQISLNLVNGTLFAQALLFGLTGLAALALLVGYRTRLATVVVWAMALSIQWRNPSVLSSADTLLRVLLFWAMFLPLGAYWSVDHAREAAPGRLSMRFLSMATVGLFLQIAFVYWFTVVLKSGREWRLDGTALYYALSAEQLATPFGAYLLRFPALLEVLTFATLGIEVLGPLLLFSPIRTGPVRTGAVLAVMGLHAGIWLSMSIGIFPWLGAFGMVCFLPGWFWDRAVPTLRAAVPRRPAVVRRLRHTAAGVAQVSWAPLRGRLAARGGFGPLAMTSMASGVPLNRPGNPAAQPSRPPMAPAPPGTGVESRAPASALATNLLALFFLGYVLFWNITTVSDYAMPAFATPLGYALGLRQNWNMFAPYPSKITEWSVIPGTLQNGRQVDLLGPTVYDDPSLIEPVSWEHPRSIPDTFNKEERWRKYLQAIAEDDETDLRLYFGKYICRNWNAANRGGPYELENFDIVRVTERTLPDGRRAPAQREVLWEHRCS